jgi:tetratricopeptide (TPR) repeat protein
LALDVQALIDRVTREIDNRAYFTPVSHIDGLQRAVLVEVEARMAQLGTPSGPSAQSVRDLLHLEHRAGRIDRVKLLSALHVLACHPAVADWEEAARLVGEQELAALELGGPDLEANLASVDRHRGVLAYLRRHHEVALDYFARALERQRTAENFTNVLCALLRLGEEAEARTLLIQARRSFPPALVVEVDENIERDPDLALLRPEAQ